MRIAPYVTPDEFCRDPENVEALNGFLQSPAGQNLLSVLMGLNPGRQSLRAPIPTESVSERSEYLLGRGHGFEYAFEIVTQTLTQKIAASRGNSSKTRGPRGPEVRPVSPPKP